jgi:hypothetical protein
MFYEMTKIAIRNCRISEMRHVSIFCIRKGSQKSLVIYSAFEIFTLVYHTNFINNNKIFKNYLN